jgi:hypothetical protein
MITLSHASNPNLLLLPFLHFWYFHFHYSQISISIARVSSLISIFIIFCRLEQFSSIGDGCFRTNYAGAGLFLL